MPFDPPDSGGNDTCSGGLFDEISQSARTCQACCCVNPNPNPDPNPNPNPDPNPNPNPDPDPDPDPNPNPNPNPKPNPNPNKAGCCVNSRCVCREGYVGERCDVQLRCGAAASEGEATVR